MENTNTYKKYYANVWLAKCPKEHRKDEAVEDEEPQETKQQKIHRELNNFEGLFFAFVVV